MKYTRYKSIVIKLGSNVVCDKDGNLNENMIEHISDQIIELQKSGLNIILVSSGAVAAGRSFIDLDDSMDLVSQRQVYAALGNPKLMKIYENYLYSKGYHCGQILVTRSDFRDRNHYENMKKCFTSLLENNLLPIVNENDAVSINQLMFTDNDELAGMIASMMDMDALIIMSSIDGLYDGNPDKPDSQLIPIVDPHDDDYESVIFATKSKHGRGGMITKYEASKKMAMMGTTTHIIQGSKRNNLLDLMSQGGYEIGTTFVASCSASTRKRWILNNGGLEKGYIYITEKAERILRKQDIARSLLPIGIYKIKGDFQRKDIIKIRNQNHQDIGMGIVDYGSDIANDSMGKKNKKPLIKYECLVIF